MWEPLEILTSLTLENLTISPYERLGLQKIEGSNEMQEIFMNPSFSNQYTDTQSLSVGRFYFHLDNKLSLLSYDGI